MIIILVRTDGKWRVTLKDEDGGLIEEAKFVKLVNALRYIEEAMEGAE